MQTSAHDLVPRDVMCRFIGAALEAVICPDRMARFEFDAGTPDAARSLLTWFCEVEKRDRHGVYLTRNGSRVTVQDDEPIGAN